MALTQTFPIPSLKLPSFLMQGLKSLFGSSASISPEEQARIERIRQYTRNPILHNDGRPLMQSSIGCEAVSNSIETGDYSRPGFESVQQYEEKMMSSIEKSKERRADEKKRGAQKAMIYGTTAAAVAAAFVSAGLLTAAFLNKGDADGAVFFSSGSGFDSSYTTLLRDQDPQLQPDQPSSPPQISLEDAEPQTEELANDDNSLAPAEVGAIDMGLASVSAMIASGEYTPDSDLQGWLDDLGSDDMGTKSDALTNIAQFLIFPARYGVQNDETRIAAGVDMLEDIITSGFSSPEADLLYAYLQWHGIKGVEQNRYEAGFTMRSYANHPVFESVTGATGAAALENTDYEIALGVNQLEFVPALAQ